MSGQDSLRYAPIPGYPDTSFGQELWGEACQEPDALGAADWQVANGSRSPVSPAWSPTLTGNDFHRSRVRGLVNTERKVPPEFLGFVAEDA